jgi:hypothetical protein
VCGVPPVSRPTASTGRPHRRSTRPGWSSPIRGSVPTGSGPAPAAVVSAPPPTYASTGGSGGLRCQNPSHRTARSRRPGAASLAAYRASLRLKYRTRPHAEHDPSCSQHNRPTTLSPPTGLSTCLRRVRAGRLIGPPPQPLHHEPAGKSAGPHGRWRMLECPCPWPGGFRASGRTRPG